MVTTDGKQLARESSVARQSAKPQAPHMVSPLRQRMIGDMELAGYTPGTQQTYIGAVVKLQDHYRLNSFTIGSISSAGEIRGLSNDPWAGSEESAALCWPCDPS